MKKRNAGKKITALCMIAVLLCTTIVPAYGAPLGSWPDSKIASDSSSANWFQDDVGMWRIRDGNGQIVTYAWLCDDAPPANGMNVWYLLEADGGMITAGLILDNTGNYYSIETNHNNYYGMIRYKNGYYDCDGKQVYIEFEQAHDGAFGKILNQDAIEKLKEIYGTVCFSIDERNYVFTSEF